MKPRLLWMACLAAACNQGSSVNTQAPQVMSATPSTVSVEFGKTTEVDIGFKDADGHTLAPGNWLPSCTLQTSDPGVATVQVVNNKVRITGQGVGTATVTVSSSAYVKATIAVQVTEPVPVITVTSFPVIKGLEYELVVDGTGILPGARVQVNGQVVTSTVLPNGRLRVFYDRQTTYAMDVSAPLQVGVFNPPNGALSNVVSVPVRYAAPDIEQIDITSAAQGSPDVTVTISLETTFGWAAYPVTKVRWNGTDLTTTQVNQFKVSAVIPAALLTTAGSFNLTVFNPTPGGGTSSPEPFFVTPALGNAHFDFSNYEPQVAWAAQAQGNGGFAQVPVVNKQVQFPVTGATATLAFVSTITTALRSLIAHPQQATVTIYQVTVLTLSSAELTAGTIPMGYPFGTSTLSGSVSGVGAGQSGLLQWGNAVSGTTQSQTGFAMTNASAGPHTLIGYLKGTAIGPSDRVFARQGQASATGVSLDFNGAESAPVATATASLTGLIAGDQAFGQMGYTTEATCEGSFLYTVPATASFQITGFPASLQGPNDRHLFSFLILNGTSVLQHVINSKALGNFTTTRPAPIAAPVVSNVAGAPYQIKQAQVNLGTGYNSATLFYSNMAVTATRSALGGATGTLKAPDLSGVAGWNPAWAPATTTSWSVGATTGIAPVPGCADGSTRTTVSVSGSNP